MNALYRIPRYLHKCKIAHSKLETPLQLILFVTNRCNARCKHCFYWKETAKKEKEITLKEFEKIAYSLKNPLKLLIVTGGEPYLRGDLPQICQIFSEINKTERIQIPTNGSMPEKVFSDTKNIMESCDAKISVSVSLDGLEKTHDKMRGVKGLFRKATETIIKLKTLDNVEVFVTTVISNHNCDEIDKISEYVCKELGVRHAIEIVRGTRFLKEYFPEILDDLSPYDITVKPPQIEKIDKIREKVKSILKGQLSGIPYAMSMGFVDYQFNLLKNPKKTINCLAGNFIGVIYSSADVALCELTKPIGNLRSTQFDFYKLWNSEEANKRRKDINNCFCTHICFLIPSLVYDPKKLLKFIFKYNLLGC